MKIISIIVLLAIFCDFCYAESFSGDHIKNLESKIQNQIEDLDSKLSELKKVKGKILKVITEFDIASIKAYQNLARDLEALEMPENIGARKKRQIVKTSICSDALEGERLIEYRQTTLAQIQSIITKLTNSVPTANPADLPPEFTQEGFIYLVSNFNGLLATIGNITSMTNSMNEQLMESYKPIAKLVCKANLGPCGTFVPFNPEINKNELAENAYYAGPFVDDSRVFIGAAYMPDCTTENYLPARCASVASPGYNLACFAACQSTEYFIKSPVAYLQYSFDFVWKLADRNNASSILNAVKIKGANSSGFYIGRIQTTNLIKIPYVQIGKVYMDDGKNNLWYVDSEKNVVGATGTFEVLTCANEPLDNNFVQVTVDRFAKGYSDGFVSSKTKGDASQLFSSFNWLIIAAGFLAIWFNNQNYE